jgi:hypothetical protein
MPSLRSSDSPPRRRIAALATSFAGPLLFWGSYAIAGLKPAIALTLALTLAHVGWRRWRGVPMQPLFLALSALAIATGIIDLIAVTPFAIRYEAVATNLIFAALFAWGALSDPPLMQRFAEASRGAAFDGEDTGRTRFFRGFAWLWAGYAGGRALLALLTGLWLPLAQALAVRAIVGTVSMVAMIALSLSARRLFMVLRARGWWGDAKAKTLPSSS